MILLYVAAIVILLLLAAIFFGRFFAWLVEICAQFFFQLDLKLDTLGLFAANGIEIKFKNGLQIGIERICLHCKWTLNDSKRLFTVLFSGVVIEVCKGNVNTSVHQNLDQSVNSRSSNNFVTKHRKTIQRLMRKCCQYIGIQVSSVEVLVGGRHLPGSLTQCILPDGLQLYAKPDHDYLSSTLVINKIETKFFNTTEGKSMPVSDACAEISFSLLMEISLKPFESLQSMTASVHVKNMDVLLSEGLLEEKQTKAVIVHKENKRNVSTTLSKPLTLIEIQENISRLPKCVDLAVDTISVTFLNKEKRKLVLEVNQVVSHLHSHVKLENSTQDSTHCDLSLQITGVNVKNTHPYKLCEWSRLRLTSKLSCHCGTMSLASMLYIESVHYTHVQEEFSYWMEYFKSRRKKLKITDTSEVAYVEQKSKLGISSRLPAELEMINTVEVTDCSTSMFISHPDWNEQPLCRAVLTFLTGDIRMSTQDMLKMNTGRELSTSFTLENFYLYMDTSESLFTNSVISSTSQDHTSLLPSSSKHVWGRVLALGSLNVKLSTELMEGVEIPASIRVSGEASSLAVEWSHGVCRFLLKWFKLSPVKSAKEAGEKKSTTSKTIALDMDFRVSGVNIFYIGRLDGKKDLNQYIQIQHMN